MDITKAKKVVELEKDGKKILITLFEGGQISSCVEDEAKKYCETCQGDDELCQEYIEHLKEKGYEATEIELGELAIEESLPKFLEEREKDIVPPVEPAVEPSAEVEAGAAAPAEVEAGAAAPAEVEAGAAAPAEVEAGTAVPTETEEVLEELPGEGEQGEE